LESGDFFEKLGLSRSRDNEKPQVHIYGPRKFLCANPLPFLSRLKTPLGFQLSSAHGEKLQEGVKLLIKVS